MGELVAQALDSERHQLTDVTEAFSGARLEQAELPGGASVVIKFLPREGDWLTRATGGAGRLRRLWESSLLHRVEPFVDHTILDIDAIGGEEVVVMRDAREDLLPARTPVSIGTSAGLLTGLASMHLHCSSEHVDGLCSIAARYAMFAPAFHAADSGAGRHPMADRFQLGWNLFAEHADRDLADAIFAVHREPERLGRRLEQFPPTLLHGDAKLENLGRTNNRIVAIDWGDLTGIGPREVDVAWYALKGAARIGCAPGELFTQYEQVSGAHLEPEAVDLVCVGSLAQMGFRLALGAFDKGPEPTEIASTQLEWWQTRVHAALDRLGLV
jgi:hypothetical protein